METLNDDTVSTTTATGTATTINTTNEEESNTIDNGEQQQQQPSSPSKKKKKKKDIKSPRTKSRKAAADAAWTRLYSATTAAQNANKWKVYKRTEEEKKKKVVPQDNAFLAYGKDILNQNPKRKQSAPTVPRKRPDKVYNVRIREATFPEGKIPKTPPRRMGNKLSSNSSLASVSSNTSYNSKTSRGSRSSVASRQSRRSTASSTTTRSTRRRPTITTPPPRVASITPRKITSASSPRTPASSRKRTPPRTPRSTTTSKKSLAKSKSTPNNTTPSKTRPTRARRTKSDAVAKDIVSAEEESTIATNENDTDALMELELDAILDDDDHDNKPSNDPSQEVSQRPRESLDTTEPVTEEEVQEREEVREEEAPREVLEEEETEDQEETITAYIDDNDGDDSFNNKSSLPQTDYDDDDADVLPPNDNYAPTPEDADLVEMNHNDSKPDADVVIDDANDDADPVDSSSFIEEAGADAEEEDEEDVAEQQQQQQQQQQQLEPAAAFEESVPSTPPSKKSSPSAAEEPPTSVGKPSSSSAAVATHVIPMSPLTPDIRNEKLRSAEVRNPSPETFTASYPKLRSVELNNSPIPNIDNIINGSNKLRSRKTRKKKQQEPKIFGKEWLLKHWNSDDSDKNTPSLLVIPEREELESLFHRIDENSSGKITKVELHTAVQILYPEEEEDKNKNAKDSALRIALENIVTEDDNALELEEFLYFIHYMVYYHNLSIPFEFTITNDDEEHSSFTITHYKFTMVAQDIIWSNLLILKDRNEETKSSDLFDVLAVIEENNTNEDDNKIIHFDSLCKYLAMRALKDIEEELYLERHSSDDDDDVDFSSSEEEEDVNDTNNGGLFHKSSGGNNLSMESVDENHISLHTLDINGKGSEKKKTNTRVQARTAFFEKKQQKKDNDDEFVNQRRRNLFKPKTWRKSFYKNQFIAKANAEQKKVQTDDTTDD